MVCMSHGAVDSGRPLRRARALASGLPARRWLSHPLRTCAECMDVAHGVYDDGGVRCCRPHLAYKSVPCGRGELRADRRFVYVLRAGDGLVMGPADVGDLLGMGPAAHL